jgi:DNA transformation protein
MATAPSDFALYCCEILSSAGPCTAKRMFGGWGLSTDGLTIAIIADLGSGEKLWLKANDENRHTWEVAGCERFAYASSRGGEPVSRSANYYSAPEDAMDSAHAMAPWARMALQAALIAKNAKKIPKKANPKKVAEKMAGTKKTRAAS